MEAGALIPLKEEDHMDLPPGFRFHPTDEELITHYLSRKVMDANFSANAIGEVDMNKCEPWDLPWRAKMGEKEWYFFCMRDRKYPTGLRTNRATEAGYWKATGKDREIYRGKSLVGSRKTLVFYKGRAPKGEKTCWVMHEFRLEGKLSLDNLPKTAKNDWVICRVYSKGSDGKKPMGLVRMSSSFGDELGTSLLPPLIDVPYTSKDKAHVPCFSNAMGVPKGHEELLSDCFSSSFFSVSANPSEASPSTLIFSKNPFSESLYTTLDLPSLGELQYSGASLVQLLENNEYDMKQSCKTEREIVSISQETGLTSDMNQEISSVVSNHEMARNPFISQEDPSTSTGHLQLDHCLWKC